MASTELEQLNAARLPARFLPVVILGIVVVAFFALLEFAADWGKWYLMLTGGIATAVSLIDRRGLSGQAPFGRIILPTDRKLD